MFAQMKIVQERWLAQSLKGRKEDFFIFFWWGDVKSKGLALQASCDRLEDSGGLRLPFSRPQVDVRDNQE